VLCIFIEHCPVWFVFSWFSSIWIWYVAWVWFMCWLWSMSVYCWPLKVVMRRVVPVFCGYVSDVGCY